MLRDDQIRRYSRHVLLPDVGGTGQKRLLSAVVEVPDAGATASAALVYLAAAGVGTILITDPAPVTPADVGPLYELSDLGLPRPQAAALRIHSLNPDVTGDRIAPATPGTATEISPNRATTPENPNDLISGTFRLQLPPHDPDDPIDRLRAGSEAAARLIRAIVAGRPAEGSAGTPAGSPSGAPA